MDSQEFSLQESPKTPIGYVPSLSEDIRKPQNLPIERKTIVYFPLPRSKNRNAFLMWLGSPCVYQSCEIDEQIAKDFIEAFETPLLLNRKEKLSTFLKFQRKKDKIKTSPYHKDYIIFLNEFLHSIIEYEFNALNIDDLTTLLLIDDFPHTATKSLCNEILSKPNKSRFKLKDELKERTLSVIENSDINQWSIFSLFEVFRRGGKFSPTLFTNMSKELKKRLKENPLDFKLKQIPYLLGTNRLPRKILIKAGKKIVTRDIQKLLENSGKPGFYDDVFRFLHSYPSLPKKAKFNKFTKAISLLKYKSNLFSIIQKFNSDIPVPILKTLRSCDLNGKLHKFSYYNDKDNRFTKLDHTDLLDKYFYLYEALSKEREGTKSKWNSLFKNDKDYKSFYNSEFFLQFLKSTPLPKVLEFLKVLKENPVRNSLTYVHVNVDVDVPILKIFNQ